MGCETTNPHLMLQNNTFTMWHLGDGTGGRCGGSCSGIDGHVARPGGWNESFPPGQKQQKQFVHQSVGPDGPWTPVEGGKACNNPAPLLLPNGSTYLVCHDKYDCKNSGVDAWGRRRVNCGVVVVAWLASTTGGNATHGWSGPHYILNAANRPTVTPSDAETWRWANITEFEDPTAWLDSEGHFHVICHAYVPVDVLAP